MSDLRAVDRIAEYALDTAYDALPPEAIEAARVFFLDTLGVGIAGYAMHSAAGVRRTVADWGQGSAATVLGGGERVPVNSAAFVNSFQIHCQEFDCLHEPGTVHAMAVLGGALLALAEERRFSGRDLITGVALGVDIAASLGLSATSGLRFFRPATAGALATTAALARLADFDERQFRDALGLAYSQLAGTMQAHVEGSVALPLQVAVASRSAVTAIQLVENGLSGPHDVLEGPFGYFALYEDGGNLERMLQGMGTTWRVTELSHKPFPTGRAAHATLDGIGQLRAEHAFGLDDIEAVIAHVPPLIKRLVGRPVHADMSVNYARLCLQYLVPVFLRDGAIDTRSFSDALLGDAEIREHGKRVSVIEDGNPDPNALRPQLIEVRLLDGTRLERAIPFTLGSPENPLSRDQYLAKFLHCHEAAGIGATQAEELREVLENLETVSDAAEIISLVSP